MSGIFSGLVPRWAKPITPPITVQITSTSAVATAAPISRRRA